MSFQIEQGLFKFDFTDHHAILGVPVDAEFNDIRKRYLKIARRLHPDSCKADNEADKQLASDLFSKLVSPAYTKFSNERERVEYGVLLGLMGKRCVQEASKIQFQSDLAKQLAQANEFEKAYKTLVNNLAEQQYQSLSKTLEVTAQISELNVVYLMRQETKGAAVRPAQQSQNPAATSSPPTSTPSAGGAGKSAPPPPPPPPKPESRVDSYYRRAEEWMSKNNLAQAILELRDALKLEPNSSRCHGLLGMVYLKQNQATMAKVHINKALQLNPEESIALEAKKQLEKPPQKGGTKGATGKSSSKSGKPDQPGGGMFGGLFGGGGKKK